MSDTEIPEVLDVRAALLSRLRFELSMGMDVAPRFALAPRAVEAPRPQSTPAASASPAVPARTPQQPVPIVSAPKPAVITTAPIAAEDKAARWAALESAAMACQKCVLAKTRNKVVFGTGNREAKLLFVGEGPGADEDEQGEPFVGKAGQLLNKIIGAMGLKREDVYICNVVKCRPPGNRTPLPDEVAACNPYLTEQIALVAPKAIVALGSPASKALLNTISGIMSLRGRWHAYKGIPVMPTYHPAFVLRQYTEEVRRAVWDDMKKVVEKLK